MKCYIQQHSYQLSVCMRNTLLASSCLLLTACAGTLDKLERIGERPAITPTQNPTQRVDYQPVTWPLPTQQPDPQRQANSLWQPGARAFFRDQRAARVGDILRVSIQINDQAQLDSDTDRTRSSGESVAAPSLYGLEDKLGILLPGDPNPESLFDVTGSSNSAGEGSIGRKETINTQIAATIIQVLPNGNFVIEGSQEVRVNYELREVNISGVIRPQDIDQNNTIEYSNIAQARINYGGRGVLSDVQQPRWGQQVIEAVSPF